MQDVLTIAIVEDDPEIRSLLSGFLEAEGFRTMAADGGAALDRHLAHGPPPDLVVLDWMLPWEDGLSICRRLRAAGGPPVLMLTAKDEDIDRILGLEMGADDYVAKPFNPRVLLAHIRAVLRRTSGAQAAAGGGSERLRVADLIVDPPARRVLLGEDGRDLPLSSAEFDLLLCFVMRPQRVLSRDQLLDWTRGRVAELFDRTIDVQVSRLRRRLDEGGSTIAGEIRTVRNAGYILSVPVTPASPGMAWIRRHVRTLLAVIAGVLTVFLLSRTVLFYDRVATVRTGPAYPRIQQAAGVLDLSRDIDPRLRPAMLRALDGLDLRVSIRNR